MIVAVFLPDSTGRNSSAPLSTATPAGGQGEDAGSSPQSFEFVRPFKQVSAGCALRVQSDGIRGTRAASLRGIGLPRVMPEGQTGPELFEK